jgi:hypothetical protein
MKNIVFFITHSTLTKNHAELTFYSLSKQTPTDKKFDCLYLYNTHQHELPNSFLVNLFQIYSLGNFFNELRIFNYEENTPKSLGADVATISSYVKQNYSGDDRVLILKSDCILSVNYFNEILNLPDCVVYFVAPFICAKERISNNEILEYSDRQRYISSDEKTFFVEDQTGSNNNDFHNRPGVSVTDEGIRFTSCYVITDFSCHFITVKLLDKINLEYSSWGGAKFHNLVSHFIGTDKCFVIHKYHGIISDNRSGDREGPVREWLNS